VPDISRIHTLIGWRPSYSLDEILDEVIAATDTRVHHQLAVVS
jgi:nucleoside-diphosphate-sugar epimerase